MYRRTHAWNIRIYLFSDHLWLTLFKHYIYLMSCFRIVRNWHSKSCSNDKYPWKTEQCWIPSRNYMNNAKVADYLWKKSVLCSEENCRCTSKGFFIPSSMVKMVMSSVWELKFFCHCSAIIKTSVNLILFSNSNAEELPERFSEIEDRFLVCARWRCILTWRKAWWWWWYSKILPDIAKRFPTKFTSLSRSMWSVIF